MGSRGGSGYKGCTPLNLEKIALKQGETEELRERKKIETVT